MTRRKLTAVEKAHNALTRHQRAFAGQLLTAGTFASKEFDRLYLKWIRARWDDGDPWVRSVWTVRP